MNTDRQLSVNALTHSFGDLLVLNDITWLCPKGKFVAIVGPSGCGKTTLLRCITGLIHPTSGNISLAGMTPHEARMSGDIGFAFQTSTLLPWRTALENVLLPLELLKRSRDGKEIAFARELLGIVGLQDVAGKLPTKLSGGMQQRVSLARSLVTRPSYLFLDEPFGSVDGLTRNDLYPKIRKLWREFGLTIVFVTHTLNDAVFLADCVLIMSPRPSRITGTIEIDLGVERDLNIRFGKKFQEYVNEIQRKTGEVK